MRENSKIMIVAGEPSGDSIGAMLAQALLRKDPSLELIGVGGSLMRREGVRILEDITHWAVVGLVEVVKNYWNFRRVFQSLCLEMKQSNPRAIVLIDFPGFNLKLAAMARKIGIPVVYYVSPQVWAWGGRRIGKIAQSVKRMIVILPFEKEFYQKEGMEVDYVGHPLVDYYSRYKDNMDVGKELSDKDCVISILPGSRSNEIKNHLDVLIRAAQLVKRDNPRAYFVIPCATDAIYKLISQKVQGIDFIRVYQGMMKECLAASKLAWVCSGTATLETGYLGVPMIVFYKVNPLTAFIIRRVIKVQNVGLVNLVAQDKIVPELLQEDFTSEKMAQKSFELLSNPALLERMRGALVEVRKKLGSAGASERAAEIILKVEQI